MERKSLFTLLLLTQFFFASKALAHPAWNSGPETNTPCVADECTAPPPDSFRIESVGANFISLGWKPAWPGAEHLLSVFEQNESGEWDPFATYDNVSGTSKTVYGLKSGKKYKFKMATKCTNGDPSTLFVVKDGIVLIVELTLNGREPSNPKPVNCERIEYLAPENEWVGYKISHMEEGVLETNYFEFVGVEESGEEYPQIRRLSTESPLVAANEIGIFPTFNAPSVLLFSNLISMGRIQSSGSFYHFGYVDLSIYTNPVSVSICPAKDSIWDSDFVFEAFVASHTNPIIPHNKFERFASNYQDDKLSVQNPFDNHLNIFFDHQFEKDKPLNIRILDLNGQRIISEDFNAQEGLVRFNTSSLGSGIYILEINSLSFNDRKIIIKL